MNTIIYSDSISSILNTTESIDISFGSSDNNNKPKKKEISIPIDNIDNFINFINIIKSKCYHCKNNTIQILNNYCIDCIDYTVHTNKFKKIINNMFVWVDKYKTCCIYQLKKYIKRYSQLNYKYETNQENITFQIKKHIIIYILKQLLNITLKNKVYELYVCINKCNDILYSNNTITWLSIKDNELNRPSMIECGSYYTYQNIYIFKNSIYIILKYRLLNGNIYNVCFLNNNRCIPNIDGIKYVRYKIDGYNCMINCLLIHVYIYCIKMNNS